MAQITYKATFAGNDFDNVPGLTIQAIDSYKMPKRNLIENKVMRTDKSKIASAFYDTKDITIRIGITNSSRAVTEAAIDTLYGYLQLLEQQLVVSEGGALRSYTASYADSVVSISGGSYYEADLVFHCSERFGYSQQYEKLLDTTARNLYNYTDSFTLGGNAPTQAPVITAFLSALAGATTNAVTISNVATGQGITVSRTWTAGDRLVINCQTRSVQVNGSDVDFTGAFPDFAPGIGYMNYQDNFSTRTLALAAYYYKRFV